MDFLKNKLLSELIIPKSFIMCINYFINKTVIISIKALPVQRLLLKYDFYYCLFYTVKKFKW